MIHARSDYQERIQDSAGLIPDDEPVLLIRGQDKAAVHAARAWCDAAAAFGADPEIIQAIRRHIVLIGDWQRDHGSKVPDAPPGVLSV